jgi:hypothetical protein
MLITPISIWYLDKIIKIFFFSNVFPIFLLKIFLIILINSMEFYYYYVQCLINYYQNISYLSNKLIC